MVRRGEFFKIRRWIRRFDRESGKFVVNISYETAAPKPSKRVVAVAESFGLGLDKWERFVVYDNVELKIGPKDIVLITGDSGSGKSVLLKALEKDVKEGMNAESINIGDIQLDPDKPLIETVGKTVEEGLELLSKVGLNDAFLFLRTFEQLSDGQKYRYRIAKMMESKAQFWIMDEFAATLDRDTAKIVAFNVQKLARQEAKVVLAATTHTDLFEDLKPSVYVHKRFGKEIEVKYYPNEINKECSLVKDMRVVEGSRQDYCQLAGFHYRSHKVAGVRKIFCLRRGEELCGVVVYSYPPAACFGRRMVLPRMNMREMNEKLSIISRVVVHPKYRTIGLGYKLVRATLDHVGAPYVETVAVMAKYNPFFEKAGMRKIAESQPVKEALRVAELLKTLGFNITFLRSEKYVTSRLSGLNAQALNMLRTCFSENKHPRYMKEFSFHDPYGRSKYYKKVVKDADLEKLTKLIGICGMLLQTKVYLLWKGSKGEVKG